MPIFSNERIKCFRLPKSSKMIEKKKVNALSFVGNGRVSRSVAELWQSLEFWNHVQLVNRLQKMHSNADAPSPAPTPRRQR